jgi:hypothetical protein
MTSTTHQGEVFTRAPVRRALGHPRLRSRALLARALAPLAALGLLVLPRDGRPGRWWRDRPDRR